MAKYYFAALSIGFILFLTPVLVFSCQENEVTKKWVLNQPASPLKVTISDDGEDYSIKNYSSKHVRGYRLGCVVEEGNKIKIKRKASSRKVDIAALDASQSRVFGKAYTVYADKDFYPCVQTKTKLAVLEVAFSDGSSWVANLKGKDNLE